MKTSFRRNDAPPEFTELIKYETMRVRVLILYDELISTKEAKDTAIRLIKNEEVKEYASNKKTK